MTIDPTIIGPNGVSSACEWDPVVGCRRSRSPNPTPCPEPAKYRCSLCGEHGQGDGKARTCALPGVPSPQVTPSSPEPIVCANAAKVRVFVGVDPGAKGACCVLASRHSPEDDASHGKVLSVSVFDLPTVARDDGGTDLDVLRFQADLRVAIAEVASCVDGRDTHVVGVSAIVERPQVGGAQRFRVASLVTQAINVGAVWAAVVTEVVGDRRGEVSWASSMSGGCGWRAERGGSVKGGEYAEATAILAGVEQTHQQDCQSLATTDRCVAILLADLGRMRWLGTAVRPKTKGAAQAVKSKRRENRKAAVAKAVAPLTMAKAKDRARLEHWCAAHRQVEYGGLAPDPDVDVAPTAVCMPRMHCCEARLLDWAWRQRPDLPGPPVPTTKVAAAVLALADTIGIYKRAVTSKAWTVAMAGTDDVGTMTAEVFDVLEAHGLVQLSPGVKMVRYRPTERGLAWAAKLRVADERRQDAST